MENKENILPLQDRVRLIRIRTFFENSSGNPFGLIAGGLLAFLAFEESGLAGVLPGVWFTLLVAVCVLIFFFQRYVNRLGLQLNNADRLFRLRTVLGAIMCGLYGGTVVFLPSPVSGVTVAFLFVVLSAIVSVGYMTYATVFSYCLMVNVLTLWPYTAFCFYRYLIDGDSLLLQMGIVAVLWQLFAIAKAYRLSRFAVGEIVTKERLQDEVLERRQTETALKLSEAKSQQLASMLQLLCDNVPDMIWAKDLQGRYTFANKALCEKLLNTGSTAEPLGKTFGEFVQRERQLHAEDHEWFTFGQFAGDVDQYTLGRTEPTVFEESGNACGRFVYLDVHQARFLDAQGEIVGTVGCARDITERKASEALVQHLAHHDALTGLPNRALLADRLNQALAQARRDMSRLAVMFVDLDRLKPVNDTLGHEVGDQLLKEAAVRLQGVVMRQTDTVARLGGDEFVIILKRINRESDVVSLAGRILQALSQPFSIAGHTISISASLGIAVYPKQGETASQLLRNADIAMYGAKRAGRNDYRFFDPEMTGAAAESERP